MKKFIVFTTVLSCALMFLYYCGKKKETSETAPSTAVSTTPKKSGVLQSTGPFGALMLTNSQEVLLPIVNRDSSGIATKLTGVLWTSSDSTYIKIDFNDAGLPSRTVIGDFLFMFMNWDTTANTVNISKIYTPSSYIQIYKNVPLEIASETSCFPSCNSNTKNLVDLLKLASRGINLGACAISKTVSLDAMDRPCQGPAVASANLLVGDETWLGDLNKVSGILTATDAFHCAGESASCLSSGLDVWSRTADQADKVYNDNSALISSASTFIIDASQKSGVVQLGSGLPTCTSSYECTPDASVPCYPSGTKQCSADCTWGSCK